MQEKRGFTLIELSIVLVIISLIVSSIIGGNALMHPAALRNVVRDFHSYQTAFNVFKNQYDAYPGDFSTATQYWPNATTGANDGNGDNKITCTSVSSAANLAAQCKEPVYAWHHLYKAEIIPGYTGVVNGSASASSPFFVPNQNAPRSKLTDGAGYLFYYDDATYLNSYSRHVLMLGGSLATGLGFTQSVVSPVDTRTIDQKMDDGRRDTGKLRAITGGGNTGNCIGGSTSTGNYDLTNIEKACVVYYMVD